MKFLSAMICFLAILVGCSPVSQPGNAVEEAGPEGSHAIIIETNTPVVGVSKPAAPSGSTPMGIKVRPPSITVAPIAGTPGLAGPTPTGRAGWQMYTIKALKVALDYPEEWGVSEQVDGTTFTSPQGDQIQLQALLNSGINTSATNADQQCNNLINSYGLTVVTCFDASTLTYSAAFSPESNNGLAQPVLLSTTDQAEIDVYRVMLDSLHPIQ